MSAWEAKLLTDTRGQLAGLLHKSYPLSRMENVSEISVAETSGGPFATRDGAEEGD